MPRIVKAALLGTAALISFTAFWFGCLVFSWVILPLVRLRTGARSSTVQTARCQDFVGYGLRFFTSFLRAASLLRFDARNVQLRLPDPPFVMIANHPTLIDVALLMGLVPRVCCVVKTELFRSRVAGGLMRACGHIESGDADPLKGAAVIQEALRRCENGQSVLVFPEGTRSPEYSLRRFRPGVFEISLRAGVPIVPILITCYPPTLSKGLPWYALPKTTAKFDLIQLPTALHGADVMDARLMAHQFQEMYQTNIDLWKSGLGGSMAAVGE